MVRQTEGVDSTADSCGGGDVRCFFVRNVRHRVPFTFFSFPPILFFFFRSDVCGTSCGTRHFLVFFSFALPLAPSVRVVASFAGLSFSLSSSIA